MILHFCILYNFLILQKPTMAEYGIKLLNLYVSDINVPEDDPAVMQLKKALAKKSEMEIVGYSYQQEQIFFIISAYCPCFWTDSVL